MPEIKNSSKANKKKEMREDKVPRAGALISLKARTRAAITLIAAMVLESTGYIGRAESQVKAAPHSRK